MVLQSCGRVTFPQEVKRGINVENVTAASSPLSWVAVPEVIHHLSALSEPSVQVLCLL